MEKYLEEIQTTLVALGLKRINEIFICIMKKNTATKTNEYPKFGDMHFLLGD